MDTTLIQIMLLHIIVSRLNPIVSKFVFPSLASPIPLFWLISSHMAMDQYLLIPFLVGWTSIYQLFWCSLGARVLTHCHIKKSHMNIPYSTGFSTSQLGDEHPRRPGPWAGAWNGAVVDRHRPDGGGGRLVGFFRGEMVSSWWWKCEFMVLKWRDMTR